jgi:imidazolonepropionase
MSDLLIHDINELVICRSAQGYRRGAEQLNDLEVLHDAAVAIERGRIVEIGENSLLQSKYRQVRHKVSAGGRLVSPGLVDCHSHLVHAGSRHDEYDHIVTGRREPGKNLDRGILRSVRRTREATNEALEAQALKDLDTMLEHGSTTVEIKTGYGLDRANELRLLKLQTSLEHEVDLARTFLGAHILPDEYRHDREGYVQLVIDMLEGAREYAEFCDVCCDPVGFTYQECLRIAERAMDLGMNVKVHGDQTGPGRGAELAARVGATSVDHLDYISDEGVAELSVSECVGVLLPAVTLHLLEMTPSCLEGDWVDAKKSFMTALYRRLVNENLILAISADYNPGSSPTLSMQMTMQLAARLFRASYAEIWHMSTINAAKALGRSDQIGSVEPGKRADLIIWDVPEHGMVINRFGSNLVDTVVKGGRIVVRDGRKLREASL